MRSLRRRYRIRCCRARCSVNRRLTNLNARQKPVKTEQRATSRPWGCRLRPLWFLGQVKNRTRAGQVGRSTSEPSIARTRRKPFHNIWGANCCSYRLVRRLHNVRQNVRGRSDRAWQKASSVTQPRLDPGQRWQTQPQARRSPWVMDSVCRATSIMSQATTSGVSRGWRWGAQPVCWATAENSRADMTVRNRAIPVDSRRLAARLRTEPIADMIRPPCVGPMDGGHPMTTRSNPSIGTWRLSLLVKRSCGLA